MFNNRKMESRCFTKDLDNQNCFVCMVSKLHCCLDMFTVECLWSNLVFCFSEEVPWHQHVAHGVPVPGSGGPHVSGRPAVTARQALCPTAQAQVSGSESRTVAEMYVNMWKQFVRSLVLTGQWWWPWPVSGCRPDRSMATILTDQWWGQRYIYIYIYILGVEEATYT